MFTGQSVQAEIKKTVQHKNDTFYGEAKKMMKIWTKIYKRKNTVGSMGMKSNETISVHCA